MKFIVKLENKLKDGTVKLDSEHKKSGETMVK
jgi:hypothetical protein